MQEAIALQKETSSIHNLMGQNALFHDLDQSTLDEFANLAEARHIPKGKVLHIQGDDAEWFYLVERGWIKLFRETFEGDEAIIDILTTNHSFGENALFESDIYSYNVQAVEDVVLYSLPVSLLKKHIKENNQLAMNMLTSMSAHRLKQHREIEHLNLQNAPQRIGCFLLRLCPLDAEKDVTLHLPYDKTLIASRLGMKPETFSRALAKLKDATNIAIKGPSVHIDSMQKLIDYTCMHCSTEFPCDDLIAERTGKTC